MLTRQASRRRSAVHGPAHSRPTTESLPDELLAMILDQLGLKGSCRAALVSRRWARLAASRQLGEKLRVAIKPPYLPHMHHLARWLNARAAPQLRCLHLELWPYAHAGSIAADPGPLVQRELGSLATGMLAACAMHGRIREVFISLLDGTPFELTGSLAAGLTSLHSLEVSAESAVWTADLSMLSSLHTLRCGADTANMAASARLPPNLTQLLLEGRVHTAYGETAMPPQVSSLSRLEHCVLIMPAIQPSGFEPLAQLPSLHTLEITGCMELPSCISRLTRLASLHMEGYCDAVADGPVFVDALCHLTKLTHLSVAAFDADEAATVPFGLPGPPPTLTALAQLRSFSWLGVVSVSAMLPAGTWLAQVEQLSAPCTVLAKSLPAMQGMLQLRTLAPTYVGASPLAAAAVLIWADRCPTLRCLRLGVETDDDEEGIMPLVQELQRRRPDIELEMRRGVLASEFRLPV
ncbi:hypothetical protein ABPG75_012297 [Micractinium tetrahymenae]